ncbi:MAG: hypothetical protein V3R81_01295 [Gammaproteobacteria bacterium]
MALPEGALWGDLMAQEMYDVVITNLGGGRAHVAATRSDGAVVGSIVRGAKVNTAAKLAAWLVVRQFEPASRDDTLTRRLSVTYDAETGIVSDVTPERLPVDAARRSLPTPEQVRVLDVETPTGRAQALEALARAIEYMAAQQGVR